MISGDIYNDPGTKSIRLNSDVPICICQTCLDMDGNSGELTVYVCMCVCVCVCDIDGEKSRGTVQWEHTECQCLSKFSKMRS